MDFLLDAVQDALKDGLLSIPVLFLAYLLMELLERSEKLNESTLMRYSRKAGPALGGLLGVIPQCGISGAAASLFATGAISVGTMLAVFFATSDEMLPVMLSSLTDGSVKLSHILAIVAGKAALGILLGYLADGLLRKRFQSRKDIHSFCEREHCSCDEEEGSVLVSALKHTVKIALLLILVATALNLLFHWVDESALRSLLVDTPVLGELLVALFGLIPNCAVSVVITDFYLEGILPLGCLFSGLLANAGIGLLVLLRTNKNWRENLTILSVLYGLSAVSGIVITLMQKLLL